ncbi:GntR family transcriptional regulator [Stenotrophomonas sp. NPDC087984]
MGRARMVDTRPQTARELKFRRLAAELRRRVLDGTWPQGTKMPTEQALAAETGLSVTTVRRTRTSPSPSAPRATPTRSWCRTVRRAGCAPTRPTCYSARAVQRSPRVT